MRDFLPSARSYIISNGSWFTPEIVAARASETDSCVMHAAHLIYVEAVESGLAGLTRCTLCAGWCGTVGQTEHSLCTLRAARGAATPLLDGILPCYCHPCSKDRGGR